MTDLDDLLVSHVRQALPPGRPPLAALRRRAARRRQAVAGSALAAVVLLGAVAAGGAGLVRGDDIARTAAGGTLAPREPSVPGLGVLAGRVAEVPELEQRPVTLRFTDAAGTKSADVATRQGAAWEVELPPGTWRISAVEGGGVCQSTVNVVAGAWQRHDIGWPCKESTPGGPPDGAPSFSGTVEAAVGERVRAILDVRCGVGPISVDGALFYPETYSAPGTNPPGWSSEQPGYATRIDLDTVRFLADDSTVRITFRRLDGRRVAQCPAA